MATILVDHPHRDIPGMLLVQSLLDESTKIELIFDHQDLYFPTNNFYKSFWQRLIRDDDIIITTSYNVKRTPNIALRSKIKRIPLVVYHSEQFYNENFKKEKLNLDYIKDYLKDVHYHFVWGEYYKKKLIDIGVDQNKIYVVGSVKEDLAGLVVNKNVEKDYDFLFISNFVAADFTQKDLEVFRSQFNLPKDFDPRNYFKTSRKGMLKFIIDISKLYPEKKILVRRHPGESKEYYSPLLKFNNVKISVDGPISEDIKKSKIVLLQDSTSIFELERFNANWISVMFGVENDKYKGEPKELFDLHDKDMVINCISMNKFQNILGSSFLKNVGVDYYSLSESSSDKIYTAITEICKKKHKFNYNLRFFKNCMLLLAKLSVWKISLFLYSFGVETVLYKRFAQNQSLWEKGDHIIEKGMVEKFKGIVDAKYK